MCPGAPVGRKSFYSAVNAGGYACITKAMGSLGIGWWQTRACGSKCDGISRASAAFRRKAVPLRWRVCGKLSRPRLTALGPQADTRPPLVRSFRFRALAAYGPPNLLHVADQP